MNYEEFEKAMNYIQDRYTLLAMDYLGISKEFLYLLLIWLTFLLILLITFIIIGINAFSIGGLFGVIVNAGLGLPISN